MTNRRIMGALVVGVVLALLAWQAFRPDRPEVVAAEMARRGPPPIPLVAFDEPSEPIADDPVEAHADVHCELPHPIATPYVEELDLQTEASRGRVPVTREGHWLILHPQQEAGVAWLHTTLYEPVPIAWIDGACTKPVSLTPRPRATLRLEIDESSENQQILVVCREASSYRERSEEAGFLEQIVLLERGQSLPCHVAVTRTLAMGSVRGEMRPITVTEGETIDLSEVVPTLPDAGWQLSEQPDGSFAIDALEGGSPAHAAGLWSHDRIVEVGGVPVRELDVDDVEARELPMRLVVSRLGEEREVVVE